MWVLVLFSGPKQAGFAEYERVPEFNLFHDESAKKVTLKPKPIGHP